MTRLVPHNIQSILIAEIQINANESTGKLRRQIGKVITSTKLESKHARTESLFLIYIHSQEYKWG